MDPAGSSRRAVVSKAAGKGVRPPSVRGAPPAQPRRATSTSAVRKGSDVGPSVEDSRPAAFRGRQSPRSASSRTPSDAFPSLRESLPLLFFGAAAVVVALYLKLANSSPFATRVPVWEYAFLLGAVAIIGGILASRVPNEEEAPSVALEFRPAPVPPEMVPTPETEPEYGPSEPTDDGPPAWQESWGDDELRELSDIETDLVESRRNSRAAEVNPDSRPLLPRPAPRQDWNGSRT
jgi:hypothetical protein